jgi:hypothetical protein
MKRTKGLTEEEDLYLRVTLGRQKKHRFFTPFETANLLKRALKSSENKSSISQKVGVSVDMINKILRLNSIKSQRIIDSIVWQIAGENEISMSAASELARLKKQHEQLRVYEGILAYSFTSKEIKELVTLYSRSGKNIEECIEQIKEAKPKTIHTNVIIGKIADKNLSRKLSKISSIERNKLLRGVLDNNSISYKGVKLEGERFVIVGHENTLNQIMSLSDDFEATISNLIKEKVYK